MRYERTELALMLDSVYPDLKKASEIEDPWVEVPPGTRIKSIDPAGVVHLLAFRVKDGTCFKSKRRAEEQPESPAKIRVRLSGTKNKEKGPSDYLGE